MEQSSLTLEQEFVTALRRRRAELRESMSALEHALAAPMRGGPDRWRQRVHVALVELSADFRAHIDITEGPDGLYRELRAKAPRLANAMAGLTDEHGQIAERLEALVARADNPDVVDALDTIRDAGNELLGILMRHRQRGADLVFEAYEFDIGGEE